MWTKSKRIQAGFTLLELMIAATVLIVALVGLIAAYAGCFTLNESAKNLTIAINGAQKEMEGIRNLSFSEIDNQDGSNFEIAGLGIDAGESEGIIEVDSSDSDLLIVTVTVCWRQKSGRIFGEDTNLNGIFEPATEDTNGNGQLDSPAQLVTSIARR